MTAQRRRYKTNYLKNCNIMNIFEGFVGGDLLDRIQGSPNIFMVDGVEIGRPFNLAQLVGMYGKDIIPNCLGIYHLFYHDQLVYVGMSKSIRGRLLCHLKDKDMPFNNVLWFCAEMMGENVTIADVLRIEYNAIKRYKPVLNQMHANCR